MSGLVIIGSSGGGGGNATVTKQSILNTGLAPADIGAATTGSVATAISTAEAASDAAGTAASAVATEVTNRNAAISAVTPTSIGAATPSSVTSAIAAVTPSSIGADAAGSATTALNGAVKLSTTGVQTVVGTVAASVLDKGGNVFHTAHPTYGAKSDRQHVTDGVTTAASTAFTTTTSNPFTVADVGKTIHIPGAGAVSSVSTTLTTALTAGTAVATFTVAALSGTVSTGAVIVTSGGHVQVFKTPGAASAATTVSIGVCLTDVDSNTPNYSFPSGSTVTFAADLVTTIAAYVSASQVTLTTAPSSTLAGQSFGWATDDSAAIQAAMTACSAAGGGTVVHRGKSMLAGNGAGYQGALLTYNNVSFVGTGEGTTVLYPVGNFSAFGDFTTTSTTPRIGSRIANLTIDGCHQSNTAFSVNACGIRQEYAQGCTYEDLTIQNCLATGLGVDFLTGGTSIRNVKALGNGRLNQGGSYGSGSSGIGIATGQYAVEAFSVTDCYAYGNGRYGIFIETQTATHPIGPRIVNCFSQGNYNHGFGDSGGSGATFEGCVAYANNFSGFSVDAGTVNATPGDHVSFVGCHSYLNTQYGFAYYGKTGAPGVGHISLKQCKAWNNSTGAWIAPATSTTVDEIVFDDCDFENNNGPGIYTPGPGSIQNLVITGGRYRSNGQTSSTNKAGVEIACNVTRFKMSDAKCWDDGGTQKQSYGLQIVTGFTVTDLFVTDNDFTGNLTGAYINSGTVANRTMHSNRGVTEVVSSAASITLGDRDRLVATAALTATSPTSIAGARVTLIAQGGAITFTPATGQVRGAATLTVASGTVSDVQCDGTNWW